MVLSRGLPTLRGQPRPGPLAVRAAGVALERLVLPALWLCSEDSSAASALVRASAMQAQRRGDASTGCIMLARPDRCASTVGWCTHTVADTLTRAEQNSPQVGGLDA
jgi:hypothetical protein